MQKSLLVKQENAKIIKLPRSFFLFGNGFLLASMLYFYIEDSYEKKLFETLAAYVKEVSKNATDTKKSFLLNSLRLTHQLAEQRTAVFGNSDFQSIKSSIIRPVTFDLMTGKGACGSYAFILSRILTELNIPNRIVQMKVNGLYSGHVLVEAKTNNGWGILDGSYNLFFQKSDGTMADCDEVQKNWSYYSSQLPPGYNTMYNYEGVRYTNWDKIPIIMPVIQSIITFTAGKDAADHLSLRTYFLRKYHLLFRLTEFIYASLLFGLIRSYVKRNRHSIRHSILTFVKFNNSKIDLIPPR